MSYKYATKSQDYADYASGTVFYNVPGHPAFPIRLTSEIFQRAEAVRAAASGSTHRLPILYDPVCGAAYHLSTLAYLHWHAIGEIIASDINADILTVARRNLSLLTIQGLDRRIEEISMTLAAYGKPSHAAALASAGRLRRDLLAFTANHAIPTRAFEADATDPGAIHHGLAGKRVNLIIADVPYGRHATWQSTDPAASSSDCPPVWCMLEALYPHLAPDAVVAIAADKAQSLTHNAYRRADRFQIGKRQIVLLQPNA